MSKTRIKVVYNRLPEIARKLPVAVGKIVESTAHSIADDAKISVNSGNKSGRTYKRGKKYHVASAPGEAPATDTGQLAGSTQEFSGSPSNSDEGIEYGMTGPTTAEVIVNADYGLPLEFGGAHVAPRPFMRPAAKKNRQPFIDDLKRLEEELK